MNILGVMLNMIYALIGIVIGLSGMKLGYKLLDKLTDFDTNLELTKGNLAIGVVVAGIFIGMGICSGLIIGMALN